MLSFFQIFQILNGEICGVYSLWSSVASQVQVWFAKTLGDEAQGQVGQKWETHLQDSCLPFFSWSWSAISVWPNKPRFTLFCREIRFVLIYALLGVKFWLQKSCLCNKNDKYQVCFYLNIVYDKPPLLWFLEMAAVPVPSYHVHCGPVPLNGPAGYTLSWCKSSENGNEICWSLCFNICGTNRDSDAQKVHKCRDWTAVWWSLEDTKREVFPLENVLKSIWYIGRKNKLFPLYRSCVLGFNKENACIGHLVKGLDALLSRSRQVEVQKGLACTST